MRYAISPKVAAAIPDLEAEVEALRLTPGAAVRRLMQAFRP